MYKKFSTSVLRRVGNAGPVFGKVNEVKLKPEPRVNESTDKMRARLFYQSRKRGILETCVILGRFAKLELQNLSREELMDYDDLMNENDWDIFYWVTQAEDSPTECPVRFESSTMMEKLRKVGKNEGKEIMKLPDL